MGRWREREGLTFLGCFGVVETPCLSWLVYSLSGVRAAPAPHRPDHQLSWLSGTKLLGCQGTTGYHGGRIVKMLKMPQYLGHQEGSEDESMTILPTIFRNILSFRMSGFQEYRFCKMSRCQPAYDMDHVADMLTERCSGDQPDHV